MYWKNFLVNLDKGEERMEHSLQIIFLIYCSSVFSQSHAIKTVRRIKRNGGALEDLDVDLPLPK